MIPVFKPSLPTSEHIIPYIQSIDSTRWYTNGGPLITEFESRLALHFNVSDTNLTTCSNGTIALLLCLKSLNLPTGSVCAMPSWTFAATPSSAIWAGMSPFFIDVIEENWQIDPDHLKKIATKVKLGSVIVVAPFGAPVDLEKWNSFVEETSIPVIVDAAAGFDSFLNCGPRLNNLLVTVSMHATKVSGIGEGAVIIGGNDNLINRIKLMGNFGFKGNREAIIPGINTKLSEYTAACGLAFLDNWTEYRKGWEIIKAAFIKEVNNNKCISLPPEFHEAWVSSYGNIQLMRECSLIEIVNKLKENGVEARQWWGNGCHTHIAYEHYSRDDMATTDKLAKTVLGLPYWLDLGMNDLKHVFYKLGLVLAI